MHFKLHTYKRHDAQSIEQNMCSRLLKSDKWFPCLSSVVCFVFGSKSNGNVSDLNRFNKKLKDTEAIERDRIVMEIELQDQTAEAVWSFNGKPIVPNER